MSIRCIGKSKDQHGTVSQCSHTSETPTNPARPEWGFLCPDCANAAPNRNSRPQYHVELPDVDKPNYEDAGSDLYGPRGDTYAGPVSVSLDELEKAEMDQLRELDLF